MPILDIQLVGPVPAEVRRGLSRRIADAAGRVLASPRGQTWVKVRFLKVDAYSENGGGPPEGVRPVLASVLLGELPEADALSDQAASLARVIADACQRRPENVHLVYEPPGRGRVAFGGRLLA